MIRATASRRRAAPQRASPERWTSALAFVAIAGLVVVGAYLVHPIASGYGLPVGPDGPVYVWWARYADAAGLDALPGARIGVSALTLTLGSFLGTGAVETVTLLGPVLAAAAGVAGASLLDVTLGPSLARAMAAAALTGTFAAYLAGGWLGNTQLVALFLAAGAALALARRSWRAVAGAAALLAASGLTHRIAALFILLILAGVIAAFVPDAIRRRRSGERLRDSFAARVGIAVSAGAGVAAAGLLPSLGAGRLPGDTSQDGFFRRLGLRDLLADRYRERLAGDAARATAPMVSGLGLSALWIAKGWREGEGSRFLATMLASWAVLTVAGIVAFAVTGWGPPNRVLVFAFFLPLAAAAGVGAAWRIGRGAGIAAIAAALVFAASSMLGWFRQSPAFTSAELGMARAAGRAVASVPHGTPIVFPYDTQERAAAYHVTRTLNVLRMGLPADRIGDAHLGVGTPADVAGGRPTLNGDPEHDAIATAYAEEIASATATRPPVIVLIPGFTPSASLPAFGPSSSRSVLVVEPGSADAGGGLSPLGLVLLSVAAFLVLAVLGGGWAGWMLAGAGVRAAAAASPATGAGVLTLAGVACGVVGLEPGGASALVASAVVGAGGYLAAWRAGRG